jgi:hypothetical protein
MPTTKKSSAAKTTRAAADKKTQEKRPLVLTEGAVHSRLADEPRAPQARVGSIGLFGGGSKETVRSDAPLPRHLCCVFFGRVRENELDVLQCVGTELLAQVAPDRLLSLRFVLAAEGP